MGFDAEKAAKWVRDNAKSSSTGYCARHVQSALLAGGAVFARVLHAKSLGSRLLESGFYEVVGDGRFPYTEKKGDVVVIQPYEGGGVSGHTAIFDGTSWYSDFKQRDFWGGPGFRSKRPDHAFYRHLSL